VLSRRRGVSFESIGEGYYVRDNGDLMIYLIVPNELPIIPKNYSLLLFASSAKKFRQFLQQMVEERNWNYIRFAYRLQSRITKEVLAMAEIHSIPKKDLEFMAKDIGPEILPYIDKEDLLKQLSLEDRLRGLKLEERRRLRQLLDELDE